MGATVTIKTKFGEVNYEFDTVKDGEIFKKDLEKEFVKINDKIKRTTSIKKTKDVKFKPKEENYYDKEFL